MTAEPFHGELSQGKRTQVLADFKAERLTVVVATDVAARGLDIARLPVVVNYDLPRSASDYTHRIGRTGRAGEAGLAVSFVSAATLAHWRLIEKRQQLSIELERLPALKRWRPPHPPPACLTRPATAASRAIAPARKTSCARRQRKPSRLCLKIAASFTASG